MLHKIKVLHIIPNFGAGGAERLLVNLLEAFDRERFEVAAVSLYPESVTILEKEIKKKELKVYFLNKRRGLDLRIIPQLNSLFRSFRPDVIHTHLYVLRYTLLPTLFCKVPVRVHTVHNIAQKEVDWLGKLVHWIAFRLGGVVPVSISQEVANTVRDIYGQGINTPLIYNGIPTTRFVSKARRNNAKSEKDVVLLHIGRFAPQKNHKLLIEAFALAVKEYTTMQLWLVGDGPLRRAVERLVKERELEEKVFFLGIRDDVPELLADSDVFILPSDWEGVPLTVLEAMAADKPVIATAVGGVPELVEDGVTGILVPPCNSYALAQGILRLVKNTDLRQRMGKAAQKRALERFDITRTAREYEALYLKLLRECGRA
ncbi:glycosyl transferase family 1 [Moorella sp. E308F]|jgi:sugar transferase (PEP-CTERM/EpsH1 system associated)|uniref:glycosyltransferase n=1 Tax=Moorella sp. E308F TaxID=2572682 RepID=UPI0010FFBD90|nr:glycosyltransferase [Moorella sp. E308F]GEA16569.1 glycosyl transferase family 1 [Moorella sp. E308F]